MDLDADGRRDVISGSWPGEIHLFRGDAKGGLEKPVTLGLAGGGALKTGSASVAFATDWNGDGRLDLVLGNIEGEVHVALRAEAAGGPPAFEAPKRLSAGGRPIAVQGGDAGPCVADWDGDGRADLLVGTGDGHVVVFRNGAEGKGAEPALAAGEKVLAGGGPVKVAHRAKIAVADWNGDGALDLLVGDYESRPGPGAGNNDFTNHGQVRVYLRVKDGGGPAGGNGGTF